MGIKLKTKEERRADTPLAATPTSAEPITDMKSALKDINERSAARQKSINESRAKTDAARIARNNSRKPLGEGSRLSGLASFGGTTGK
jgi:hypothetical protein